MCSLAVDASSTIYLPLLLMTVVASFLFKKGQCLRHWRQRLYFSYPRLHVCIITSECALYYPDLRPYIALLA